MLDRTTIALLRNVACEDECVTLEMRPHGGAAHGMRLVNHAGYIRGPRSARAVARTLL
jgi:hypothetical protein